MSSTSRREFLAGVAASIASAASGCGPPKSDWRADGSAIDGQAHHPTDGAVSFIDGSVADAAAMDSGRPDIDSGSPEISIDASADAGSARDAGAPTNDSGPEPSVAPNDPTSVPWSDRFNLSVASGDPTMNGAMLWTHYAARSSSPLWLAVYRDGIDRPVHERPVMPDSRGFVLPDVSQLTANAWHRYAFFERSSSGELIGRSGIGRFRTTPSPEASPVVRLGASSCNHNDYNADTLHRAAERSDLDAFVLLGDSTYNDGAISRDAIDARWDSSLARASFRALRRSTATLATWDDHEVFNNWNPETISPDRQRVATKAFFDHMPIRRSAVSPDRVWRKQQFGRTVEVFLMDVRSERRPSTRGTRHEQYISQGQLDALKDQIEASPAVFKLIVTPVPITDLPGVFREAHRANDKWMGYRQQRHDLLAHIRDRGIRGVVFLGGDVHFAYTGRVSQSGPGQDILETLAGPGGQSTNGLFRELQGRAQFDWVTGANNFVAFEFRPTERTVVIEHIGPRGAVLNRSSYRLP